MKKLKEAYLKDSIRVTTVPDAKGLWVWLNTRDGPFGLMTQAASVWFVEGNWAVELTSPDHPFTSGLSPAMRPAQPLDKMVKLYEAASGVWVFLPFMRLAEVQEIFENTDKTISEVE